MLGRLIVFIVIFLLQWYFYQAVHNLISDYSYVKRNIIKYSYFSICILALSAVTFAFFVQPPEWSKFLQRTLLTATFIILASQFIGVLTLLPDDFIRLFRWVYIKIFGSQKIDQTGNQISRLKFFSYISVGLASITGISLLFGLIKGAHLYKLHKVKLAFPNLPKSFNGLKIVQISDIHTGSFSDTSQLIRAFDMVMAQKPDIIFFTGDLVNNLAEETNDFLEVYKKLSAPYGVYSVFGNHDYGDYVRWEDRNEAHEEKELLAKKHLLTGMQMENIERLKQVHQNSGWHLLWNTNKIIDGKNGEQIAILGVQNCPYRGSFVRHRYGDLNETFKGIENIPFKILLSHDPSHWSGQVTAEEKFKNIDLTLSGHTHGMQFGIEIPGIKWSPIKYFYPQWAGLYQTGKQYLYVNRGLGYLGYNGRVGIWPEITVAELYCNKEINAGFEVGDSKSEEVKQISG